MTRPLGQLFRAATVTALVLMVLSAASTSLAAERPNVILVITDDQGYGEVAAHGNTMIQTPYLDRLHSQSVRLTDFHVDPTCSPTRSALMSGRYSTRTGVWHTIMGRSLMSTGEVTLAEMFRAGGYRTGMFGKWHLGDNYPNRPQDQGFDEVFCHGGGGVGQGPDYWGNDYFDDTYFRNGTPEEAAGYCTDVWFDNALAFIERNRQQPFFAYIATNAPHGPYNVAEKYSQPYVDKGVPQPMANFYGMITNIDENMGKLMKRLDQWGLDDDTILIFMTDNGSAAGWRAKKGEGTWPGFNAGMRDGKGSEYDGGHRVPFFIRWPAGNLSAGRDVDQLSAHVDVLPTLADLCVIALPAGLPRDGTSLVPALRGDADALRDRTLFVHSQRIEYPEKWRKCAVMTDRWRLVNGQELYDIEADPGQQKDLAADHADVVGKLREAYEGWWKSLSRVFDGYVRIGIGAEAQPQSLLHAHDWHVTDGGCPWSQSAVRGGQMGNGFWAIDVVRTGTYEITLRRWPEQEPGSIEATKARLKIGDFDQQQPLDPAATEATFTVPLAAGPTQLETWLTLENGKTRGAYFVYIRRK